MVNHLHLPLLVLAALMPVAAEGVTETVTEVGPRAHLQAAMTNQVRAQPQGRNHHQHHLRLARVVLVQEMIRLIPLTEVAGMVVRVGCHRQDLVIKIILAAILTSAFVMLAMDTL